MKNELTDRVAERCLRCGHLEGDHAIVHSYHNPMTAPGYCRPCDHSHITYNEETGHVDILYCVCYDFIRRPSTCHCANNGDLCEACNWAMDKAMEPFGTPAGKGHLARLTFEQFAEEL